MFTCSHILMLTLCRTPTLVVKARIMGRSSGSSIITLQGLPNFSVTYLCNAPLLQRRVRAGVAPASKEMISYRFSKASLYPKRIVLSYIFANLNCI